MSVSLVSAGVAFTLKKTQKKKRPVLVTVVHADGDVVPFHHCHLNFLRGMNKQEEEEDPQATDRTPPNPSAT